MNRPFPRLLATLALSLGLLALVTASGGCEAIINGDVPSFGCAPTGGSCPPGKACSPNGECIAACPDTPCPAQMSCVASLCVDGVVVMEASVPTPDAGPDATVPLPDAQPETGRPEVGPDGPVRNNEIGALCMVDANCLSSLCGDTSILTDAVKQAAGGSVCTKPCCRSEDCPNDYVCFGPGTGGNYCVKAAYLPRAAEAGTTLGAGAGGTSCANATSCRSGVCIGGKCGDACCSNGDCGAAGAICRRQTVDGHQVHACGDAPAAAKADGTSCSSSPVCASGLCISGGSFTSYCRPRCCGQKSCQANPAFGSPSACMYVAATTTEYLTGCFVPAEVPLGAGAVGATCTLDSDCSTGQCALGAKRFCTDVCCSDDDCRGYPAAKRCRPISSPNEHYLICQP